jgi:hypothetical protein
MMGFGWGAGRRETSWKNWCNGKIKYNTSSRNIIKKVGVDCSGCGRDQFLGCCEHGNDHSGFIKCEIFWSI